MTPTQKDRRFTHKVVLYDEDVTLGPKIAADIEEDPNWELIALCATLGDLSFVLNRVTVDVLLLHLNPESDDRALRVGFETRSAGPPPGPVSPPRAKAIPGAKRPTGGGARTAVLVERQRRRIVGALVANGSSRPDMPHKQGHYGERSI